MWTDTHLHIEDEKITEADSFFQKARAVGVGFFLVQATSLENAEPTYSLTQWGEDVFVAEGLHPHVADLPYDMGFFREMWQRPKVLAVGEIGLDYFYDFSSPENQKRMFEDFLKEAVRTEKPVVIHCREAFADAYPRVKECLPPGYPFEIHSFTGTIDEGEKWLQLGAMFSFNGMITFKKADNVRETLAHIPMERILLETDSPYLAPVPLRGQENTSANIPIIAQRLAEEKHLPLEEVERITTENALKFFGFPGELNRA